MNKYTLQLIIIFPTNMDGFWFQSTSGANTFCFSYTKSFHASFLDGFSFTWKGLEQDYVTYFLYNFLVKIFLIKYSFSCPSFFVKVTFSLEICNKTDLQIYKWSVAYVTKFPNKETFLKKTKNKSLNISRTTKIFKWNKMW